jgi:hypothetical protein
MRTLAVLSTLILTGGLLTGCTTLSGGAAGTLVGGLAGAGIGAIAGDPVSGALLGAGVGMGAGALIGGQNERTRYQQDGLVYDDPWGARGHYEAPRRPVYVEQPVYVERPVYREVYVEPVAYYPPPPPPAVYCPPPPVTTHFTFQSTYRIDGHRSHDRGHHRRH